MGRLKYKEHKRHGHLTRTWAFADAVLEMRSIPGPRPEHDLLTIEVRFVGKGVYEVGFTARAAAFGPNGQALAAAELVRRQPEVATYVEQALASLPSSKRVAA